MQITTLTSFGKTVSVNNNLTGLNEVALLKAQIRLFPNPANNQLTLQNSGSVKTNYFILDISRREIAKGEFTNSAQVDLSNFASGSYVVRFESGSLSAYKKIVIEK